MKTVKSVPPYLFNTISCSLEVFMLQMSENPTQRSLFSTIKRILSHSGFASNQWVLWNLFVNTDSLKRKSLFSLEKASHNWPPDLKCGKIYNRTIENFEKEDAEKKMSFMKYTWVLDNVKAQHEHGWFLPMETWE